MVYFSDSLFDCFSPFLIPFALLSDLMYDSFSGTILWEENTLILTVITSSELCWADVGARGVVRCCKA